MQSRRARFGTMVAVVGAATGIFAAAGVAIDRRVVRAVDASLGDALVAHARTVAAGISMPVADDPVGLAVVTAELARARIASEAEMIVLVDATGHPVAADPPGLGAGAYLRLDTDALAAALTGEAAHGARYRVGEIDLKSAFAPVVDPFGDVVGAVGIEAPATYFDALRAARLALGSTIALGIALIVGLMTVAWRFWSRSEASERAMWRAQHLATIGQMTATMAHEVRNPLSVIRATAERIRRKYGDGSDLFDFIPDEVDRLDRLTRWYLDFAKSSEGQFAPVSLAEIAAESVRRLRKEDEEANIRVDGPDGDERGELVGDRDRLLQAVLNVLINAREAMPGGGTVTVRISGDADRVRLSVADAGPGIPADERDRIFEPFYTTKATGSGLGLAVVRQVVEAHGGTVGVDDAPGGGALVWLELPRRR